MQVFWKKASVAALMLVGAVGAGIAMFGAWEEEASPSASQRENALRSSRAMADAERSPATEPSTLPVASGAQQSSASPADSLPSKTVRITAVTGLQYDKVRFTARPGQEVRIVFRNESNMLHNLVFTYPGQREPVVKAALQMGAKGPKKEYVPRSGEGTAVSKRVRTFAPVLQPGGFFEMTLTAPHEEGAYPYVCTYPGHGYVMYGVMRVTDEPKRTLPPPSADPLVPPDSLRGEVEDQEATTLHPYSTKPPIIYRTFMPRSGPASIAVGLTGGVSYAFDAGRSMLRYAWHGGFVDNSEIWKGHVQNQKAKIIGDVFFRREGGFPLRIGRSDSLPTPSFRGYRLLEGRPVFEYEVGSATVRQHLRPADGEQPGLEREFTIEGASGQPVRFIASRSDSVAYRASAGTWRGDTLRLAPDEARRFTITTVRRPATRPPGFNQRGRPVDGASASGAGGASR